MKTLEVRRHSYTKREADGRGRGSALSQAGVGLARELGAGLGPFDYVLASTSPRTVETALAMGFAVDDTADMGGGFWEAATAEKGSHHAQWDWGDEAFGRYAALLAAGGPTAALGGHQVGLWRGLLEHLAYQGHGLVLGHGGLLEPGLVAISPGADHSQWGRAIAHGEGARLCFEAEELVEIEFLRLEDRR